MIKCLKCGTEVEQVDASLQAIFDDPFNLCQNCLAPPSNANQEKVPLIARASIIEINTPELVKAAAAKGVDVKQKDLMYVSFKLVHANRNKNSDKFLSAELDKAQKTPIFKLLNWEHGEPNIGTIFDSEFVKSNKENEDDYLKVMAAISKFKYPDYAKEIQERHKNDELFFSMETYFENAECSDCKQTFAGKEETYCSHLKGRHQHNSTTARILHDLTFAGAGVVKDPADELAESLVLAKNKNEEEKIVEKEYTKEDLQKAIDQAIADFKEDQDIESLKTNHAALESNVTSLTSANEELSTKNTELQAALEILQSEKDALATEFNTYKNNIAVEKTTLARLEDLRGIGYNVPSAAEAKEAYDALYEKVKVMDENAFATLKDFIVETLETTKQKDNDNKDKGKDKSDANNRNKSDKDEDTVPQGALGSNNGDDASLSSILSRAIAPNFRR